MAERPLSGYPMVFGNKNALVIDHAGPKSYATNGETYSAQQLGWGGLDFIIPGNRGLITVSADKFVAALSISRTYFVEILMATTAVGAVASATIKWYVTATGAEVAAAVDLSAEYVRLFALGV